MVVPAQAPHLEDMTEQVTVKPLNKEHLGNIENILYSETSEEWGRIKHPFNREGCPLFRRLFSKVLLYIVSLAKS